VHERLEHDHDHGNIYQCKAPIIAQVSAALVALWTISFANASEGAAASATTTLSISITASSSLHSVVLNLSENGLDMFHMAF
jgi:hypothetical protein